MTEPVRVNEAGWLSGWLAEWPPGAPVRVRVRLPDIGWAVEDWAFGLEGTPDGPEIVVTVHGFDLDFPDVARRLRALADHLASHNLV